MDYFVTANGIRLHVLEHPGGSPPIVLMHGLTANAHSFDGLVAAGLSPRFRVLAVDLRGRGRSDQPASGYGMAEHAADILGLLDALGIERAVLGGHSFGALLTLYLAAHHPARVARLILIDAAARLHPNVRELIQPSLDRLGRVAPSWEAYLAAIKGAPQFHGWWDPLIEGYYRADVQENEDGTVQARSRPEAIAEAAERAAAEPWDDLVRQIEQPALLLNAPGPYGPPGTPAMLPRESALETVEALADCRYVEIPGNHMTMLFGDNARKVVAAIAAFAGDAEQGDEQR